VTPPSQNPSSSKPFPPWRFKPSKVYQRRPPLKSLVVKILFHGTLPLSPMAHPWEKDLYKPLNMATIPGYPNTMPKDSNKRFPKFPGNIVIVEDHLYTIGHNMDNAEIEHEDVAMKLLASSLTEEALRWFRGLPDNHIASYEYVSKLFKSRWTTKKDNVMFVAQLNQINKKENETVSEFDTRFHRLYSQILVDFLPIAATFHLQYVNAFDGKFCFILKDKNPTYLEEAKEYSVEIEEKILDSKVDPFQYPRVKVETKTKASNSSALDLISLLTQKIDQMSTQFVQA
jgi:hypothetical protein